MALFVMARRARGLTAPTIVGICIDVLVASLVAHAAPSATAGVALMLLFHVGASSLLLPLRAALGIAVLAGAGLSAAFLWTLLVEQQTPRPFAELMMFTVSYLGDRRADPPAPQPDARDRGPGRTRGADAVRLAEVNELIIRRMRTGVLLVDREAQISLANEAAMLLLGEGAAGTRNLAEAAPELALRLSEWLRNGLANDTPLRLGSDQFEVVPRFARLLANSDNRP